MTTIFQENNQQTFLQLKKEGTMKDLKLFLAAFLGIFFVFSPVVNNFFLVEKLLPTPGITSKPLPSIKEKNMIGQQSPNLKMIYLDGKEVELEQFKGKTIVLYFWSTWCPTCWKGMVVYE